MKSITYLGFQQLEIMVMLITLTVLLGVFVPSAMAAESEKDLLKYLEDAEWTIRLEAVKAVGQQKDSRGLDRILAALKEQQKEIRGAAATALGAIGERRAVPALIVCLQDEDSEVRAAAATALGWIAEHGAAPSPLSSPPPAGEREV